MKNRKSTVYCPCRNLWTNDLSLIPLISPFLFRETTFFSKRYVSVVLAMARKKMCLDVFIFSIISRQKRYYSTSKITFVVSSSTVNTIFPLNLMICQLETYFKTKTTENYGIDFAENLYKIIYIFKNVIVHVMQSRFFPPCQYF